MASTESFYLPEQEIFCNDGREEDLLQFILSHPKLSELRDSPSAVLDAIDEYGRKRNFLMNVGQYKGAIITEIISRNKPNTMLEIGGYVGYSAILFGDALRRAGGQKYVSLEMSPKFASVARELVAVAGLDGFVEFLEGPCRQSLKKLQDKPWDIIFLDHAKADYLPDLKLCEALKLIAPGTTVIADDMKQPGNPQYSEYVRSPPKAKRVIYNLYRDGGIADDPPLGNPTLRDVKAYKTKDAIEISRCVDGELK
ncbi:O-methyltransferase [Aspergillus tanneri]|uniref:catechol O-methyltransferase n=1 Tax=Aspergillus tanneri TaxID=1220188 RepID=A0A5M9MT50_9EURO|nr:uncharacterized protein ATNIH1004_002985 [Aspergillus tanneri]KAA8650302.1 hypothetical protein ATNIH1004_002985 [Aspergillus tanneri]